jgi:hypothetical protein
MKKEGCRDQEQQKADGGYAIDGEPSVRGPESGRLELARLEPGRLEPGSQFFPGQVPVVESLFRQGVWRAEAAAPGKKIIGSFV